MLAKKHITQPLFHYNEHYMHGLFIYGVMPRYNVVLRCSAGTTVYARRTAIDRPPDKRGYNYDVDVVYSKKVPFGKVPYRARTLNVLNFIDAMYVLCPDYGGSYVE